jgi:hypothetical protein
MKTFLPLLILPLFFLQSTAFSQSPTVQSIIEEMSIDTIIFFARELTGDVETIINGTPYTIQSRNKFQPGNDMAANYIQQKLEFYGLEVHNQSFSSSGRNVYAIQPGTDFPNQKYIICAHYDDMPSGSLAPGLMTTEAVLLRYWRLQEFFLNIHSPTLYFMLCGMRKSRGWLVLGILHKTPQVRVILY